MIKHTLARALVWYFSIAHCEVASTTSWYTGHDWEVLVVKQMQCPARLRTSVRPNRCRNASRWLVVGCAERHNQRSNINIAMYIFVYVSRGRKMHTNCLWNYQFIRTSCSSHGLSTSCNTQITYCLCGIELFIIHNSTQLWMDVLESISTSWSTYFF